MRFGVLIVLCFLASNGIYALKRTIASDKDRTLLIAEVIITIAAVAGLVLLAVMYK
jgi:hypothetical protein